ncbi:MAG TPA: hypothetical protein VIQ03_06855 [Gammaproteobacteria bacterium]
MSSDNKTQKNKHFQILKNTSSLCFAKCKYLFIAAIVPLSAKCAALGKAFCMNKLVPCLYIGTRLVKHEFIRIHEKQNWFQRCGATFAGNAIGLSMAMLSTKVVEHFVEVREMSNLWGLLASRPVVNETTYEVFSFVVEFAIALIVFTLTEHFYEELMQKREMKTLAVETED